MKLIIGGAYQGKLDYAKERYKLKQEDIFTCDSSRVDFSRPCVNALEEFIWHALREGLDPRAILEENRERWEQSVLICRDIFCGVVPMDPEQRVWRQTTGRICQYLAREAESVTRIFCGLEQKLK